MQANTYALPLLTLLSACASSSKSTATASESGESGEHEDSSAQPNQNYPEPDSAEKPDWFVDESSAFEAAASQNKGVVIDFEASWCAPCKEIKRVFANQALFAELHQSFVPLRFDVSDGNQEDEKRQNRYACSRLPTVIFLDARGKELLRYSDPKPNLASMRETIFQATTLLRR